MKKMYSQQIIKSAYVLIILIPAILVSACSTASDELANQREENEKDYKIFSFYNDEGEQEIHYRIKYKDGEIAEIYRNGEKVPENDIEKYEDIVEENLNDIFDRDYSFHFNMDDFRDDMREFKREMRDKKFEFHFDKEKFKEGMENLKEEMKRLKDMKIEINFDTTEFRFKMEELRNNLKSLNINPPHIEIDFDNMKDELSNISKEINKIHIEIDNIDFDKMKEELDEAFKELDKIKIEINDIEIDLNKTDEFIEEVKTELIKDGFIESEDQSFDLSITSDKMKINDKEVSGSSFKKYKEIYKEYFGKEPGKRTRFHVN